MEDGIAFLFACVAAFLVWVTLVPASFVLATPVILFLALGEEPGYWCRVRAGYANLWRFWYRRPGDLLTWVP